MIQLSFLLLFYFVLFVSTFLSSDFLLNPRRCTGLYWRNLFSIRFFHPSILCSECSSSTQTSHGFYGSGVGQFMKPLGLLLDDLGNLLVADNKTSKIMVFNSEGRFVKDIQYSSDLRRPMGFLRLETRTCKMKIIKWIIITSVFPLRKIKTTLLQIEGWMQVFDGVR